MLLIPSDDLGGKPLAGDIVSRSKSLKLTLDLEV